MKTQINSPLLAALLGVAFTAELRAQPSTFTYQGRLTENGAPYDGSAEFQFTLWDAESGGTAVATNDPVQLVAPVSNGLLTVALDFGNSAFDGAERFLQIEVRTTIGAFTTLSPRQAVTPAPQAIHAARAAQAMSVDMGPISNPTFIGTTTDAPLEFFVNNRRVLRIEDNGNSDEAPNVIGGSSVNTVASGVVGATISGGGVADFGGSPEPNTVGGDYATIGGGIGNAASGFGSTVGGGLENTAGVTESTIGGGGDNTASGDASTVSGGRINAASGVFSTVGGGFDNLASGAVSTVPGGDFNVAAGIASLAAGRRAKANHDGAFVWADSQNADFSSTAEDEFAIRALAGVRIANAGSGRTLLRLETERPWEFRQRGSGAATALELVSLDSSGVANKNFVINTTGGGSVGIGTVSPSFKLHVNGSVAGVGTYNNLSDGRYKKNIQPLANALEKVAYLQGVSFDWKREDHPDMKFEQGRQLGFIAQDLRRVVPEAVSETENGILHAAYGQIIPLLVEAIKEQSRESEAGRQRSEARSQQLQQRLERKETEITALKQRLEKLEELLNAKLNGGRQ